MVGVIFVYVSGTATSAATNTLRQLLNKSDAALGPWQVGTSPLEESLQTFYGAPGGPMYHPWEAGLPFSIGYTGTSPPNHPLQLTKTSKRSKFFHSSCRAEQKTRFVSVSCPIGRTQPGAAFQSFFKMFALACVRSHRLL